VLIKEGGGATPPELHLVDDAWAAAAALEQERQLVAVARRLMNHPELGITSVTVCGPAETYNIQRDLDDADDRLTEPVLKRSRSKIELLARVVKGRVRTT
jgi:hypothetical protein